MNLTTILPFPTVLLIMMVLVAPVHADDVTDQIGEAVKAYEKEDYNTAITALDSAATLIRQKKSELVGKLLPEPPEGWEAGDPKTSSAPAGMFGGGINAERTYSRKVDGKMEKITVTITTDSPLMQTMGMMFSNPMFMGQENKLIVINGEKVIANQRDNSLMAMIANKVLVKVDGDKNTTDETMKMFFNTIDFDAIKGYAQ